MRYLRVGRLITEGDKTGNKACSTAFTEHVHGSIADVPDAAVADDAHDTDEADGHGVEAHQDAASHERVPGRIRVVCGAAAVAQEPGFAALHAVGDTTATDEENARQSGKDSHDCADSGGRPEAGPRILGAVRVIPGTACSGDENALPADATEPGPADALP